MNANISAVKHLPDALNCAEYICQTIQRFKLTPLKAAHSFRSSEPGINALWYSQDFSDKKHDATSVKEKSPAASLCNWALFYIFPQALISRFTDNKSYCRQWRKPSPRRCLPRSRYSTTHDYCYRLSTHSRDKPFRGKPRRPMPRRDSRIV